MNRHGISLNPTEEEAALLRRLWRADDAEARARSARSENERLRRENAELRARLAALPENREEPSRSSSETSQD